MSEPLFVFWFIYVESDALGASEDDLAFVFCFTKLGLGGVILPYGKGFKNY